MEKMKKIRVTRHQICNLARDSLWNNNTPRCVFLYRTEPAGPKKKKSKSAILTVRTALYKKMDRSRALIVLPVPGGPRLPGRPRQWSDVSLQSSCACAETTAGGRPAGSNRTTRGDVAKQRQTSLCYITTRGPEQKFLQ